MKASERLKESWSLKPTTLSQEREDAIRKCLADVKTRDDSSIDEFLDLVRNLPESFITFGETEQRFGRELAADRQQLVDAANNLLEVLAECSDPGLRAIDYELRTDAGFFDLSDGQGTIGVKDRNRVMERAKESGFTPWPGLRREHVGICPLEKEIERLVAVTKRVLPKTVPRGRPRSKTYGLVFLISCYWINCFKPPPTPSRDTVFHEVMREIFYALGLMSKGDYKNEVSIETQLKSCPLCKNT